MATQITLPKDAEGKDVPLDTETLYDEYGNQRRIVKFIYHNDCETGAKEWTVEYDNGVERFVSVMYLIQPDSLKQLAEDLNRAANYKKCSCYRSPSCAYAGINKGDDCDSCKLADLSDACLAAMIKDVTDRVNRLCDAAE